MDKNNMLFEIHATFSKLPARFMHLVLEECNWSNPTFYRKMRDTVKPAKLPYKNYLSSAEREGVLRMAKIAVKEINAFMDKYS
ncbi:hypothetical protein [Chitinophaga flava]|uniref:Uncharacterized protein n=1 Tax=Chitinophaga flava TaxID=2259036 RepID=A0A365Y4V4_9BACT|nr:hypothetical protein [Chitinophaga flava]RBL93331.1 hypothetical protein DF182_12460 [Chitinophaga flava]